MHDIHHHLLGGVSTLFKIQDALFHVPRIIFTHSPVFQDMFSLPTPADIPVEGSNEQHPLVLEDVNTSAFQAFVSVAIMSE
jgi:hypothetical protein